MKRAMLAVLVLVLLTSLTWGADWYCYQGTISHNYRALTGEPVRASREVVVLLCYDTTPWGISVEDPYCGSVFMSGEFAKEGTKLQFRASGWAGCATVVGRGSFNAKETALNLQAWAFFRWPDASTEFGQFRFRGKFVDVVTRP